MDRYDRAPLRRLERYWPLKSYRYLSRPCRPPPTLPQLSSRTIITPQQSHQTLKEGTKRLKNRRFFKRLVPSFRVWWDCWGVIIVREESCGNVGGGRQGRDR